MRINPISSVNPAMRAWPVSNQTKGSFGQGTLVNNTEAQQSLSSSRRPKEQCLGLRLDRCV